jgi:hypothetical protein
LKIGHLASGVCAMRHEGKTESKTRLACLENRPGISKETLNKVCRPMV